MALVAAGSYAAIAVGMLGLGGVATIAGWGQGGWRSLVFLVPIALYGGALAYGAARLRSKSPNRVASPWVCVPLLCHAAAGHVGASALILGALGVGSRSFNYFAPGASMLGMLLGWFPVLSPFFWARRAEVLLLAGLSGPIFLILLFSLVPGL